MVVSPSKLAEQDIQQALDTITDTNPQPIQPAPIKAPPPPPVCIIVTVYDCVIVVSIISGVSTFGP